MTQRSDLDKQMKLPFSKKSIWLVFIISGFIIGFAETLALFFFLTVGYLYFAGSKLDSTPNNNQNIDKKLEKIVDVEAKEKILNHNEKVKEELGDLSKLAKSSVKQHTLLDHSVEMGFNADIKKESSGFFKFILIIIFILMLIVIGDYIEQGIPAYQYFNELPQRIKI